MWDGFLTETKDNRDNSPSLGNCVGRYTNKGDHVSVLLKNIFCLTLGNANNSKVRGIKSQGNMIASALNLYGGYSPVMVSRKNSVIT